MGWLAARRSRRSAAPSYAAGRSESGCRLLRLAGCLAGGGLLLFLVRCGRALVEFIDASRRVHQLLLAGEQRVACRTDLNGDLGYRRARRERVAARAVHAGLRVPFWVDLGLHSLCIIASVSKQEAFPAPQKASGPMKLPSLFLAAAGSATAAAIFAFGYPSARSAAQAATPPPTPPPIGTQQATPMPNPTTMPTASATFTPGPPATAKSRPSPPPAGRKGLDGVWEVALQHPNTTD